VVDYKDGMHPVAAKDNPQMEQYGMGVLAGYKQAINLPFPFSTIRLTIIQPKITAKGMEPISSHDYPVQSFIMDKLGDMVAQAAKCESITAPLIPGDEQCRYCPAKGGCSALADHTVKSMGMVFPTVGADVPTVAPDLSVQASSEDPAELSAERIVQVLEAAPLMRQFIESVQEEALRRMKKGIPIPGLKLVNGRGSRKWNQDDEAIAGKLKAMGVPKDAIWKTSLVSPAQSEKLAWKNRKGETNQLSKRQVGTIQDEYVTHMSGALTVALESDDRNAVILDAAPMFRAVEQSAPVVEALPAWMM